MPLPVHAIFIGGPPNSGKSVLIYRLASHFIRKGIALYAFRASPDGEGNWTQEGDPAIVAPLRNTAKRRWTNDAWGDSFTSYLCRTIEQRQVPMLVDVGGKIAPNTEQIAGVCTRAIILSNNDEDMGKWREMLQRLGRPIIAELHSRLDGEQTYTIEQGVLKGTITDLRRGVEPTIADAPAFDALARLLHPLLALDTYQLYDIHKTFARGDNIWHIDEIHRRLQPDAIDTRWQPDLLPALTSLTVEEQPDAIFGASANWVYSTIVAHCQQTPQLFDKAFGWIDLPHVALASVAHDEHVTWEIVEQDTYTGIAGLLTDGFIQDMIDTVTAPAVSTEKGFIIDGKLPIWLSAALTHAYLDASWIALFQPQLHGAVIVYSRSPAYRIGAIVPYDSPFTRKEVKENA